MSLPLQKNLRAGVQGNQTGTQTKLHSFARFCAGTMATIIEGVFLRQGGGSVVNVSVLFIASPGRLIKMEPSDNRRRSISGECFCLADNVDDFCMCASAKKNTPAPDDTIMFCSWQKSSEILWAPFSTNRFQSDSGRGNGPKTLENSKIPSSVVSKSSVNTNRSPDTSARSIPAKKGIPSTLTSCFSAACGRR